MAGCYGHGEADGEPYIVFEFIDGETLESRRKRHGGKVDLADANRWFMDILAGLEAAHRVGVLHRDLKPENIMIGRDDRAVITDFGMARSVDTQTLLTRTGTVMGTIAYMPPDQFEAKDPAWHWDLYAAAALYYELVTGQLPHGGADIGAMYGQKKVGIEHPLRRLGVDIPRNAERLIEGALDPRPTMRPESADLLRQAFAAAWAKSGVRPGSTGTAPRVENTLAGDEGGAGDTSRLALPTPPAGRPTPGVARGPEAPDPAVRSGSFVPGTEAVEGEGRGGGAKGLVLGAVVLVAGAAGALLPGGATTPGAGPVPAGPVAPAPVDSVELRESLARKLEGLVAAVRDEPAVQQALGMDADVVAMEEDAVVYWKDGQAAVRRALLGLGETLAALRPLPPDRRTYRPLEELGRLAAFFRPEGYERPDLPPLWGPTEDPGLEAALARCRRFVEDPSLAFSRREKGREGGFAWMQGELARQNPGTWVEVRSVEWVMEEEARIGLEAEEVHLHNPEGTAFWNPSRPRNGAARFLVSDTFSSGQSAVPQAQVPLRPVPPGKPLVLMISGHRWLPKQVARLTLEGEGEEEVEVSFPMPRRTDSHEDGNTRTAGFLRVEAPLVPRGLRRMTVRFEALQPLGDVSFSVGLEEVHQLVDGPLPALVR